MASGAVRTLLLEKINDDFINHDSIYWMNCIPDLKFYTEARSKTKMPMFKCSKHPQTEIQMYPNLWSKKEFVFVKWWLLLIDNRCVLCRILPDIAWVFVAFNPTIYMPVSHCSCSDYILSFLTFWMWYISKYLKPILKLEGGWGGWV